MKTHSELLPKILNGTGRNRLLQAIWGQPTLTALALTALGLLLAGCATTNNDTTNEGAPVYSTPAANATGASASANPSAIQLKEGDAVKLAFEVETNLNTVAKIQLDGSIVVPLVGEIKAAGKTQSDLQTELKERYKKVLVASELTVTVVSSASVYVAGAVLRPGKIPMERPLTALEAIMEAGGFDPNRARPSKVSVKRIQNGKQVNYSLDLRKALNEGDSSPFQLQPFDIIFVPEKIINF